MVEINALGELGEVLLSRGFQPLAELLAAVRTRSRGRAYEQGVLISDWQAGRVQIESLAGHHHLAPLLGAWHHSEWGHLYPSEVWNAEIATAEFEAMALSTSADRTWIAFDGETRRAEDVLGSVSLMASDDLAGYEHVTPWLASMFVAPAARGRGVASALGDHLLAAATDAGHGEVYLFTSGQDDFWSARGWRVIAEVETAGNPAIVMSRSTRSAQ